MIDNTADIKLELLTAQHTSAIRTLGDHAVISKTSSIPHPLEEEEIEEWIRSNQAVPPVQLTFAVTIKSVVVGGCTLKRIDYEHDSAELAYWIGKEFWGKSIGRQAASKLRDYAFLNLELQKLDAHCLKYNNVPSQRILENIGFERDLSKADLPVEGRFKQDYPNDFWIFYTLDRSRWLRLSQRVD